MPGITFVWYACAQRRKQYDFMDQRRLGDGLGALRVKRNPVSGDVLWQGNDADAAQVALACRAARAAFPRWARLSFGDRQVRVERFAGLLESNKAELTTIIARETGKPRWEAATEVTAMINKIAISIKAYHVRTGDQRSEMPDGAASLRHRPHGVLAVFGPYNFPGIYLTGILFRRCWQATQLSLNPVS